MLNGVRWGYPAWAWDIPARKPRINGSDVLGRSKATMLEYQKGPLADYLPYTPMTAGILKKLADLKPRTLAIMHSSSFSGDGEQALLDLDTVLKEVFSG